MEGRTGSWLSSDEEFPSSFLSPFEGGGREGVNNVDIMCMTSFGDFHHESRGWYHVAIVGFVD